MKIVEVKRDNNRNLERTSVPSRRIKTQQPLTDVENRPVVAKGEDGWGRGGLGVWG